MKRFTLRFFIALITFIIGVAIATPWYLRPNIIPTPNKPVLPHNQEQKDASISAWQVLLSFEDQDLRELDLLSVGRLQQAINVLIGKPKSNEFPLVPRLVSKMSDVQGKIQYALIEEAPLLKIPGESRLHVHLFTTEGKFLSSSEFSSGWRISLDGMQAKYMSEIGREVLVVNSQPSINGRNVAKQYYALVGEKVLLIRLEDSSGHLIRNQYGVADHPIGPTMNGRSVKEWENALESDDVAENLAALMWLGGGRWNTHKYVPEYGREDLSEDRIADEVRSREGVKVAFRRLVQLENLWVQSATELAMNPEYYNANYKD